MTDFRNRSEFKSVEDLAQATAAALDQAACGCAHALYWEKEFQLLARLDGLNQTEQDRIFNELVVAGIVLIMLVLEAPDLRVCRDFGDYLKELRDALPKAHVRYLDDLGVESKHLRDWEKLIGMRFEEYARDRHGVRAAAMKIESRDKDLDVHGLSKIQLLVPVQAVAIGCHHHICRGETDGHDDLFKLVLSRLSKFYVEFRVQLEVGRITPLMRARVALRRFIRRLLRPRRS